MAVARDLRQGLRIACGPLAHHEESRAVTTGIERREELRGVPARAVVESDGDLGARGVDRDERPRKDAARLQEDAGGEHADQQRQRQRRQPAWRGAAGGGKKREQQASPAGRHQKDATEGRGESAYRRNHREADGYHARSRA